MPQYLMAVDLRHVHLGSHSAFKLERQSSAPAPLFGRDWILLGSSLNRLIHIIKNPNGHRAANVIGILPVLQEEGELDSTRVVFFEPAMEIADTCL